MWEKLSTENKGRLLRYFDEHRKGEKDSDFLVKMEKQALKSILKHQIKQEELPPVDEAVNEKIVLAEEEVEGL